MLAAEMISVTKRFSSSTSEVAVDGSSDCHES